MNKLLIGILLASFCTTASSATISLSPHNETVVLGDNLFVNLYMDFSDEPTLGGGLDITYDNSYIDFLSFSFDENFLSLSDSSMTCPGAAFCTPVDQWNSVSNIAFGNFNGISGPALVGTAVFQTTATGYTTILTTATSGSAGPFVALSTYAPQSVTFAGTNVTVSAVPLPAAFPLMLGGLCVFCGLRKRTQSTGRYNCLRARH